MRLCVAAAGEVPLASPIGSDSSNDGLSHVTGDHNIFVAVAGHPAEGGTVECVPPSADSAADHARSSIHADSAVDHTAGGTEVKDEQHVTEATERLRELMHSRGRDHALDGDMMGSRRSPSTDDGKLGAHGVEITNDYAAFDVEAATMKGNSAVPRQQTNLRVKSLLSGKGDSVNAASPPQPQPEFFDPLFNPPPAPPKKNWNTALMLIVPLRLGKDSTDPEKFHVSFMLCFLIDLL